MKGIPREAGVTKEQLKVIIGTLLGDGTLVEPHNWGINYRLEIEHSAAQKDYVFWKYEKLKNLVSSKPHFCASHNSWRFRTISHPVFTELAAKFYNSRTKVLPSDIDSLVADPLILAVWYMDDGGKRREYGKDWSMILNTQSFSDAEVRKISALMSDRLNIETTCQRNHRKLRIYVKKASMRNFAAFIKSYVITSMLFKLPLAP